MLLHKGLSKYVVICLDMFVSFELTKYLATVTHLAFLCIYTEKKSN